MMSEAIIVLNAGSSSLKFSVYATGGSAPRVAARGQIEGLGTHPHFKAKDALVFTAGLGENSPLVRQQVCERLAWLGLAVHAGANEAGRGQISPAGELPSAWVIPTDEEGVIAAQTLAVLHGESEAGPPAGARTGGPEPQPGGLAIARRG
jgi:acetate kinase